MGDSQEIHGFHVFTLQENSILSLFVRLAIARPTTTYLRLLRNVKELRSVLSTAGNVDLGSTNLCSMVHALRQMLPSTTTALTCGMERILLGIQRTTRATTWE